MKKQTLIAIFFITRTLRYRTVRPRRRLTDGTIRIGMKRPVRRSSAARRTGRDKTERVIRPVPAGTDGTASLRLQPARKNVTSRSDLVERLAAGRTQKLHPVGPGDRPSRLGNARRIAGRDTDRSGRADRNAQPSSSGGSRRASIRCGYGRKAESCQASTNVRSPTIEGSTVKRSKPG